MKYRQKLRFRIIVSFIALGMLLGVMLAMTVLAMQNRLEDDLIGETLKRDLDNHLAALAIDPAGEAGAPFSSRVHAYVVAPQRLDNVPPEFRPLPTGIHDINLAATQYKIAVNKDGPIWGYVVYDVTPDPRAQAQLVVVLLAAFGVFLLIAWLAALWSSKRIMAPVISLAKRIDTMGDDSHIEPLAPDFADDEIGQLAAALDHYAERLTHLVERDREFNADVSHELRTPLAVIRGAVELLQGQPDLPPRTEERLARIDRAARQSTELTAALLHLVRAERGDPQQLEAVDVVSVVEEVIEFQRPHLGRKPVEVSTQVVTPFTVHTPRAALIVAVGNVIGNAFKYTNEGRVEITIDAPSVRVADTGPGVAEDEIDRLFERHYRGERVTASGTGLGLAIVKRLCELYGWQAGVAARPNGGLEAVLDFDEQAFPIDTALRA